MLFRIVNYLLWIFFFLVTLCSYSGSGGKATDGPVEYSVAAEMPSPDFQVLKTSLKNSTADLSSSGCGEKSTLPEVIPPHEKFSRGYNGMIHPL